uniref:zinc-binding dehydrogenase n=1 Tax=Cellulomonas sp. GbtcB1 TaxID=2824746 RepID=UPI001C3037EC
AADAGAAQVVVTDVDPDRLRTARRFGATDVYLQHEDLPLVDVAFELSGATRAAARALDRLDVGGALVLVGSVSPGPDLAVAPERVVRGWWRISGVHNYEPRHLTAALDLLRRTTPQRPWADLVDPPVGLAALGGALRGPATARPRASVDPALDDVPTR